MKDKATLFLIIIITFNGSECRTGFLGIKWLCWYIRESSAVTNFSDPWSILHYLRNQVKRKITTSFMVRWFLETVPIWFCWSIISLFISPSLSNCLLLFIFYSLWVSSVTELQEVWSLCNRYKVKLKNETDKQLNNKLISRVSVVL